MITVRLTVGLGNQMFQYAMGRALAHRHQSQLELDTSWFPHFPKVAGQNPNEIFAFNIVQNFAKTNYQIQWTKSKLSFLEGLKPLRRRKYVNEKFLRPDDNVLDISGDVYLEGYWQDLKYFSTIRDILCQEFTLQKPLDPGTDLFRLVQKENTVAIHVRRGDYVWSAGDALLSLAYFKKAMETLSQKIHGPQYIIFSDDIPWVKANLPVPSGSYFVDRSHHLTDAEELVLMSLCRHQIISNSTFSWWAAYLNSYPGKIVIAPARWNGSEPFDCETLIPASWIAL